MSALRLTGVLPILATPFLDDESLDVDSLVRMIEFQAGLGVDGFTVLGVLGEANRLTEAERERVIVAAVAAAGKLPVIVGTSHPGTAATIAWSRAAADLGAAAVMVAPSKQPVPNDRGVLEYYQRVGAGSPVPLVLQDHPLSTEVHLPVELVRRIVRDVPTVACVKAEAVPSPGRIAALRTDLAEGGRAVSVLTGLGGLYGFFDLETGSDGFNTGFAFPEVLLAMVAAVRVKDFGAAYRIYTRYLPLMVFEQQPGLAIRKEILRRRGLLAGNRVRHPGATIDPRTAAQLERLLERSFPGQDVTRPVVVDGR